MKLLTPQEVAEQLGVSSRTVYALCQRGELVHHRIGRCVRIAEADVDAYLEKSRVGSVEPQRPTNRTRDWKREVERLTKALNNHPSA